LPPHCCHLETQAAVGAGVGDVGDGVGIGVGAVVGLAVAPSHEQHRPKSSSSSQPLHLNLPPFKLHVVTCLSIVQAGDGAGVAGDGAGVTGTEVVEPISPMAAFVNLA
jgi:hypothetical protein